MAYDPTVRGGFPVGVRSLSTTDTAREDRQLPFEVWYPAKAGERDADVRVGRYPLVLYSHASGGHRRQSSFLCTHLASNGYVVAAADHIRNTAMDIVERRAAGIVFTPEQLDAYVGRIIADRVPDLRFLLDTLLAGTAGEVSDQIDRQRIGLVGWSFGGWAVLAAPEVDDRVGALAALAPAGSSDPLPGIIPATLTFAWTRQVPTLFLAAERDRFIRLSGVEELFARTPSSKRMFVLREADHGHFADQIDEEGLCAREQAHLFTRALVQAHMDAVLKRDRAAQRFMADDPVAALRARGVDAIAYSGPARDVDRAAR
jgi:dienelactone hydrolase